MGASVAAGLDAPRIFEHVFDFVLLAIKCAIMFDRLFAVGFRRDAGRDATRGESLTILHGSPHESAFRRGEHRPSWKGTC